MSKLFFTSLPLFAFCAFFINLKPHKDWRLAFLSACVIWGLWTTIITEALSVFHAINYWTIAGLWGLVAVCAFFYWMKWNRISSPLKLSLTRGSFSPFELSLLIAMAGIAALTAIIAWYAPPTTWDSFVYHMARIMHWIQNKSVDFYPTHILRQLHMNPWSEYAIMQFQILHKDDRFANLVQWFSMAGSLVGTSLIARHFGGTQREQIIASVITATIPMGIIQASSTQNDYTTAFWMVCFVTFGLSYKKDASIQNVFLTGSALGLAILTKATAYIFAFPFVLWIGISVFQKFRLKSFKSLVIITILTIALNTPHYIRNYDLYGSPLGPGREAPVGFDYANNIFTAPALASNMVRNIGVHLGTPYSELNEIVEKQIYKFHEIIGISANDPHTTWTDTEFHILPIIISDTYGSAFLHIFLIFFSMIIYLAFHVTLSRSPERSEGAGEGSLPLKSEILRYAQNDKRKSYLKQKKGGDQPRYMLALIGGFILFCAYLKWQPWLGSRLHLSFFVLWSPCIGIIICRIKNQNVIRAVLLILLITAVPWIISHNLRPLLGQHSILKVDRVTQTLRDSIRVPYTQAITFVENKQQCREIGLISGYEIAEYPLWSLLEKSDQPFRLEHVNVTNVSSVKSELPMFSSFTPCSVLTVEKDLPAEITVGRTTFIRVKIFGQVSVYARK